MACCTCFSLSSLTLSDYPNPYHALLKIGSLDRARLCQVPSSLPRLGSLEATGGKHSPPSKSHMHRNRFNWFAGGQTTMRMAREFLYQGRGDIDRMRYPAETPPPKIMFILDAYGNPGSLTLHIVMAFPIHGSINSRSCIFCHCNFNNSWSAGNVILWP